MLKILTFTFNSFGENCSLAWDETGEGVIIDPGFYNDAEAQALFGKIAEKQVRPVMVLLTHGHFDHIFGVKECADKYGIPVYMNQEDNYVLQHNFSQVFGLKEPDTSFSTLPLDWSGSLNGWRKGLWVRSSEIMVLWPWPGKTVTSPGMPMSLSINETINLS